MSQATMRQETNGQEPLIWLRAEHKPREARAAVVPDDARRLIEAGIEVVIEASEQRAFPIDDYVAVGCRPVDAGAWRRAPTHAIVVGLKELDVRLGPFRHHHVHFAHAFKGQRGWRDVLGAFVTGGGRLSDLEYLVDENGRRVAAFGYRAGYVGAALGLLARAGQCDGETPPLQARNPWSSAESLLKDVRAAVDVTGRSLSLLVIGARGRSGRGAVDLAEEAGVIVTRWDIEETANGGPFDALREHDVVVNCVFVDKPVPPFTTIEHLESGRRQLGVLVDVSCDPHGDANPLPLYSEPTTIGEPTDRLLPASEEAPPLDLIAIDHLPSLLPRESSEEFSALLIPYLLALATVGTGAESDVGRVGKRGENGERGERGDAAPSCSVELAVWQRAADVFERKSREAMDTGKPA